MSFLFKSRQENHSNSCAEYNCIYWFLSEKACGAKHEHKPRQLSPLICVAKEPMPTKKHNARQPWILWNNWAAVALPLILFNRGSQQNCLVQFSRRHRHSLQAWFNGARAHSKVKLHLQQALGQIQRFGYRRSILRNRKRSTASAAAHCWNAASANRAMHVFFSEKMDVPKPPKLRPHCLLSCAPMTHPDRGSFLL